jgi:hypothetical protein
MLEELEVIYPDIDAIEDRFGLERDENGDVHNLSDEEIAEAHRARKLITIIDAEGSQVAFVIGSAWVNRLGHWRTIKPMPYALYESRLCVEDSK